MPLRRRGGSPAGRWGRARATSGTGGQLSLPLADWWRWRGRGELRRAAVTRPRWRARGHADSGEARGGEAQCAAREARGRSRKVWSAASVSGVVSSPAAAAMARRGEDGDSGWRGGGGELDSLLYARLRVTAG
jgi:hypothetical protein